MATVKIHVTQGGSFGLVSPAATTIEITRPTRVQAVAEAVAMLLSTCRPEMDEVLRQVRLAGQAIAAASPAAATADSDSSPEPAESGR